MPVNSLDTSGRFQRKRKAQTNSLENENSIRKKFLEDLQKPVIKQIEEEYTKWIWVIYTPPVLLCLVWGLSTQQVLNIEEAYMEDIVRSLLSVSCFAWFMSIITNARKGIVSITGRSSYSRRFIKKKNQPFLFYIVLVFKCGLASTGFIYLISPGFIYMTSPFFH